MRTMRRRGSAAVAATAALALTLAACGSDNGTEEEPDAGTGGETTESTDDGANPGAGGNPFANRLTGLTHIGLEFTFRIRRNDADVFPWKTG